DGEPAHPDAAARDDHEHADRRRGAALRRRPGHPPCRRTGAPLRPARRAPRRRPRARRHPRHPPPRRPRRRRRRDEPAVRPPGPRPPPDPRAPGPGPAPHPPDRGRHGLRPRPRPRRQPRLATPRRLHARPRPRPPLLPRVPLRRPLRRRHALDGLDDRHRSARRPPRHLPPKPRTPPRRADGHPLPRPRPRHPRRPHPRPPLPPPPPAARDRPPPSPRRRPHPRPRPRAHGLLGHRPPHARPRPPLPPRRPREARGGRPRPPRERPLATRRGPLRESRGATPDPRRIASQLHSRTHPCGRRRPAPRAPRSKLGSGTHFVPPAGPALAPRPELRPARSRFVRPATDTSNTSRASVGSPSVEATWFRHTSQQATRACPRPDPASSASKLGSGTHFDAARRSHPRGASSAGLAPSAPRAPDRLMHRV